MRKTYTIIDTDRDTRTTLNIRYSKYIDCLWQHISFDLASTKSTVDGHAAGTRDKNEGDDRR